MLMHFPCSPAFPDYEDFCLLLPKASEALPLLRPADASNAVFGKYQLTKQWPDEKIIV